MNIMLPVAMLTQSDSFLIGPIAKVFAYIVNFIFDAIYTLTPANSLGISIIVFTLLVKFIMMPLMIKQQKSMRKMQLIQPQIQKIQKKYSDKKDPESQQKMQAEMQKLYKKHNTNPFSGCLPILIQFPIFIAMYQVFRYAPAYIDQLHDIYNQIANVIMSVDGAPGLVEQILESSKIAVSNFSTTDPNKIIDVVYQFNDAQWQDMYQTYPTLQSGIEQQLVHAKEITSFGIFDLSQVPGWSFPAVIIPLVAGGATFLQSKLMMARNKAKNAKNGENTQDTQQQTQKIMNTVFPVMMVFISSTTPAGLSIYWITSNIFQIIQQVIINRIMDQEEQQRLEEERKRKAKRAAARKRKLAEDSKKSSGAKKKKSSQGSKNKQKEKIDESVESGNETISNNVKLDEDKKPSNQE